MRWQDLKFQIVVRLEMEVVRKFWFVVLALCSLANLSRSVLAEAPYEVEDIDIDANCFSSAKLGDHLLFEYEFKYANGSNFGDIVSSAKKPNQLFHLILVSTTYIYIYYIFLYSSI